MITEWLWPVLVFGVLPAAVIITCIAAARPRMKARKKARDDDDS